MLHMMGDRIKERRLELGITQAEIEEMTGIKKNTISNYENNVSSPSIDNIAKLMEILHCDANYLFEWDCREVIPSKKELLVQNYDQLNNEGQEDLLDYSDMLASNPRKLKEGNQTVQGLKNA